MTITGVIVALVLSAITGWVAMAAIGGDGDIDGCYSQKSGDLRVVDDGAPCAKGEIAIKWAQRGPQGIPGPSGIPGATGATGAAGPTGAPGPTGAAGATGVPGPTGATGAPGATGVPGPTGVPGATGAPGATGEPGPSGVPGEKGDRGPQGPAGVGAQTIEASGDGPGDADLGTFAGVAANVHCGGNLFSPTSTLNLAAPTGQRIDISGVIFGNVAVKPVHAFDVATAEVVNEGGAGVSITITTYDGPFGAEPRHLISTVKLDLIYLAAVAPGTTSVLCHVAGLATVATVPTPE
ncbi:MAG: hypothetical protein ACJ77B_07810 [Chloroflexota bacterium]